MPDRRTAAAFREELPRLLAEHQMSQRGLGRRIGINPAYLSLVVQGRRAPSRRLLEGVARALDLPLDYFREYREHVVIESIKSDPELLERVYTLALRRRRGV